MQYELPVGLFTNENITSKLVPPQVGDQFECKGITFSVEAPKGSKLEPVATRIVKVDVIYNSEFPEMMGKYRLPVFFKTDGTSHFDRGFVDNGRQVIDISGEAEMLRRESVNDIAFGSERVESRVS